MLFNSWDFMVFFPMVVLTFWIIPTRGRSIWLLLASYYFYMSWNPKYAILMVISTAITFFSGILIEKATTIGQKKIVVALSFVSNLGILAIFKYANFALETLSALLGYIGVEVIEKRLDLLLPVGISFYTFQALGYTIDVYRKTIVAEKNFVNYALFVSFFPQLVAGPIERSGNLLQQVRMIKEIERLDLDRIRNGLLLMAWGFFQKLVIADRASILVNKVYHDYQQYGFIELSIASVLFAFQIYCDFGGYTNIARGAANVMGFSLMDNFRQPYLAAGIKDFWRRWHISLTTWFTDYLYIPLGGNRKGFLRKYINIFIVFSVSGLWHGASWNFVVWGVLHAVFQIAEDVKTQVENKIKKDIESDQDQLVYILKRLWKIIGTFILVDFAWIFFAADNITMAVGILRQMFSVVKRASLSSLGLGKSDVIVLFLAIALLLFVDVLHEMGISVRKVVHERNLLLRTAAYVGFIWIIILFGIYGVGYSTSQFIYFQF